ncbi:probable Triosephosphate isomerase [Saccharomycodes ludwigii]|uniref:Triosephosphate isomerase n=1 Tax=Saccharomycodes ludwigii TaxID=36035 RepID=A0A376B2R7_9ASCO|nr:hypothetical protein SCDLUD_003715 [Saccharomycodes ludwigii]KAH3900713.1 hypothetical protein SCDLUD_003715 [Saccharomycodes ludwigii]SSD58941.1 probable Triosephosphate isomerase [Saccharomycodes ludwigii]
MSSNRTFFVGGNFKLNGSKKLITEIVERLNNADLPSDVEVVIAPPAPYLALAVSLNKSKQVSVAGQNTYVKASGAYTGENSVEFLKDVGAKWVILGHSERRSYFHEDSELIAEKTKFAIDSGVKVILCVGELLEERKAGITLSVVEKQLDPVFAKVPKEKWASDIVVAYEPVWAIGTGLAATPDDAEETQLAIRKYIATKIGEAEAQKVRILYGGSANGKNATSFKDKKDVDGFLVGGASLKPEFIDIIKSRQ